ncbi:MAG: PEP-CTERM sorting domain-containing protein [Phycisphaerae bacterium]|jgi:hypothetical protein|nr:PEP-CTERM sorting domain-containing protein [Phycisphaerae bacterium]
MNSKRIIVVVLGGLLALTTRAGASMVRFDFTGTLNVVPAPLAGSFAIGQPFALSYVFDTNAAQTGGVLLPGGVGYADYPATAFTAAASTHSISAVAANIRVTNNYTIDEYNVYPISPPWTVGGVPSGFYHVMTEIVAQDYIAKTALSDTLLPDDPVDISGMNPRFRLTFVQESNQTAYQVLGDVGHATVTPVPEPVSLSLLAAGALAVLRRRRRFAPVSV